MNSRLALSVLALAAASALSGCYESTDVELYEPHVYKGRRDSDRIMRIPPVLEDDLSQRLQRGQTDR